jgi:hypothetical protein
MVYGICFIVNLALKKMIMKTKAEEKQKQAKANFIVVAEVKKKANRLDS